MIQLNAKQMSDEERRAFLTQYLTDRERGRRNLLWLCREVLGYPDITPADASGENHQPLLDGLHKFAGCKDVADIKSMSITSTTPRVSMYDQPEPDGRRNCLFLFPRDHLKTSIITIAHTIQWIINYPDVRILLSTSAGDAANRLMTAFLGHFRNNARFRYLYPESCPAYGHASDWGSLNQFTVPNRTRQITEPTVMAITIGKIIAGTHQDVHKHTDLVDKENVKTVNQIKDVNDHFGYTDPLLARIHGAQGWRDVEGTRYDFSDLYGTITDAEDKLSEKEKTYRVVIRSAEVDAHKKTTLWPSRYDWNALKGIEKNPLMSKAMYMAQYNQVVIPPSGGLCSKEELESMWIPREKVRQLMPLYRIHTTVDLAGMDEKSEGAYTAMVTCGFLPSGSIHLIDITHGHLTPFEVINAFFDIDKRYRPIDFKMEKNHHAQVLEPFLKQEMDKRGTYLNVLNIPRSNTVQKDDRILGLQPFIKAKRIRIVDDLPCDAQLILEMTRFPSYRFKDIVDAFSDQLQHADGDGIEPDLHPVAPSEDPRPVIQRMVTPKFMGFDPFTHEAVFAGKDRGGRGNYHEGTGL